MSAMPDRVDILITWMRRTCIAVSATGTLLAAMIAQSLYSQWVANVRYAAAKVEMEAEKAKNDVTFAEMRGRIEGKYIDKD